MQNTHWTTKYCHPILASFLWDCAFMKNHSAQKSWSLFHKMSAGSLCSWDSKYEFHVFINIFNTWTTYKRIPRDIYLSQLTWVTATVLYPVLLLLNHPVDKMIYCKLTAVHYNVIKTVYNLVILLNTFSVDLFTIMINLNLFFFK